MRKAVSEPTKTARPPTSLPRAAKAPGRTKSAKRAVGQPAAQVLAAPRKQAKKGDVTDAKQIAALKRELASERKESLRLQAKLSKLTAKSPGPSKSAKETGTIKKKAAPQKPKNGAALTPLNAGKKILAQRSFLGESQAQASQQLGVSVHSVLGWEKGRRKPDADKMDTIAAYLKREKAAPQLPS